MLQRQAALWDGENRQPGFLLSGAPLDEAEEWAAIHPDEMNWRDVEFLAACRQRGQRLCRKNNRRRASAGWRLA